MSLPYDLFILARHYLRLFGLRAVILLADRAARWTLPPSLYRPVRWLLWTSRGPRPIEGSLRQSRITVSHGKPRAPEWFGEMFPGAIQQKAASAESSRRHEFDFLGTGRSHWGDPIDWHQDVKSGHRWPVKFWPTYGDSLTPGGGADVKIPWELSRLHHLVTMAQAWWLTRDQVYSEEFFDQWEAWLAANPWPNGINWTSAMEVAIRVVSLLWSTSILADAPSWTREREAVLARSLCQHGAYIEHNLEVGSRHGRIEAANHYLANACGLACLGLARPDLPQATRWSTTGLKALDQEIRRQVLSDGFFFESSTSYHRLALEFFLIPGLLARGTGNQMSPGYWERLERMCEAVMHITGPSGGVPQIGDCDDGRLLILAGYPDWPRHDYRYLLAMGAVLFRRGDFKAAAGRRAEELFWLLGREGVEEFDNLAPDPTPLEGRSFPEAGLYTMRSKDSRDFALIRAGVPGSRSPSGHAHNDLFSLELWTAGKPVLVDPGTHVYTSDPGERNRFRSTAYHNTVMVDGREINTVPTDSLFRLGREASVKIVYWDVNAERSSLVAEHDAFASLPSPVRHTRKVVYHAGERAWEIEDALEGSGSHRSTWFWHLPAGQSPGVGSAEIELGDTRMSWWADASLDVKVEPGKHSPSYGRVDDASVLVASAVWEDRMGVRFRMEARMPAAASTQEKGKIGGDS